MQLADLQYDLPPELIAQRPAPERGASRLMHVHEGAVTAIDRFDALLPQLLRPDDLVVVNDTRVINARIQCQRPTGGKVELLLLHPAAEHGKRWEAMVRPARRLERGMVLTTAVTGEPIRAIERSGGATWIIELPVDTADTPAWLDRVGETPLPPYITGQPDDPGRYHTVFEEHPGSVAAPTASLHIDESLWDFLHDHHEVVPVTLHVGAGTFLPVRTDELDAHTMHSERYTISAASDSAISSALADGRRVVAFGTTVTRVLETVYANPADRPPLNGETSLFVRPGHRFAAVGALLTNFHLPGSTLLALVMAFMGVEETRRAYSRAVSEKMQFFSFGDAMFIEPGAAADTSDM